MFFMGRYIGLSSSRVRSGYWQSVFRMIAHLVATAILFSSILLIAWSLAFLIHWLNGIHPLPTAIYEVVTEIEVWLLYIDIGLSAIVFVAGASRFVREILEG